MSLNTLKKQNSLANLLGAAEKENTTQDKKSYIDERLWKPELDKTGNGYAVIRFLPAVKGEDLPWAKVWNHAFQGPTGQWYIENSLTTLGQKDPVSEMNSAYWNSGVESDKEIARRQKRKLQYRSNIYVVADPKHPENEGKVFLFRYGKKIFDKIMESMQPAFEDETPVNPFDFWEGANFKLKIRKVDGYWNYDKSEFETSSALFDDDDKLEKVWKKQYALKEFTAPTNFKSYTELKTRLDTVLAGTTVVGNVEASAEAAAERMANERFGSDVSNPFEDSPDTSAVVDTKEESAPTVEVTEDEEEDTMSYFEKLAEGDK
ncbi:MAG: single-stranded DNA-binding protein [Candidatus Pacebacteria bacterium]|nr:single-stranded DNA-binding protein [Candidatus Paceibacterota bacterium]